jgi:hypothetical protein
MKKLIPLAALCAVLAAVPALRADDPPKLSEGEQKALAKIRQLGGLAMELAQNDSHVEVSYQQREGKFTEENLLPLKDLKSLVHLNLRGQDVTDTHLVHLKDLTGLTRLHLEKTKITDKGLENLKGLVNLEYLNLYGTEVTDAGLENLEGMKKLKSLYLWQTKVTDAGVEKLKKELPQVEIVRGFDLDKPKEDKDLSGKHSAAYVAIVLQNHPLAAAANSGYFLTLPKKPDDKPKDDKKTDKPKEDKKPDEKPKEDKKPEDKAKEDKKPDAKSDKPKDDKKPDDKPKDEKKPDEKKDDSPKKA